MTNKKEIIAGIIIIGNEILSGRTKDLNTSLLSKWLNSIGIKVAEVRTIPDIEEIIINTENELKQKFDYVFTSGGIGPTHDDITSESVSKAFSLKYEIHKEAYKILEKYYQNNVVGSLNLLNAMVRHGVKQLVFSSSASFSSQCLNQRTASFCDSIVSPHLSNGNNQHA